MKRQILLAVLFSISPLAWPGEAKLEKIQVDSSIPALERGVEAFMDNCHGCHNLKYIRYRDLASLGLDKNKIKNWQGDQTLDAPMTGLMSDEVAMQSFGKIPPDLSLMAKAREGGANYLYSYLTGYYMTAEGVPGNHIFPETKMPDPLNISSAEPAQRTEIQAKARDIVSFLAWAADPHEQERIKLGYYVMGYLLVLTVLLYILKGRIWSGLK